MCYPLSSLQAHTQRIVHHRGRRPDTSGTSGTLSCSTMLSTHRLHRHMLNSRSLIWGRARGRIVIGQSRTAIGLPNLRAQPKGNDCSIQPCMGTKRLHPHHYTPHTGMAEGWRWRRVGSFPSPRAWRFRQVAAPVCPGVGTQSAGPSVGPRQFTKVPAWPGHRGQAGRRVLP